LDNIISRNNFANNGYGIGLYIFSNRNIIFENNVTASGHAGILLASSMENDVSRNNITGNQYSVELVSSSNNTIIENDITNNSHGVALYEASNYNDIIGNNVERNGWGVETDTSIGNRIYHNNFINNTPQVFFYEPGYSNVWDTSYPGGGNYWSDYKSTDFYSGFYQNENGSDGIADAPYSINSNNEDHYPLMGMFYDFVIFLPPYPTGGIEHVNVISNSIVSGLYYLAWLGSPNQYLQSGQLLIQFLATEENGTVGFCRLMIPKTVLNASSYIVLVDWKPVNVVELPTPNSTEVYLYFTYIHSEHEIIVTIPEFPLMIALPTVIVATLLSVRSVRTFRRKRVNHVHENRI
jgi:parallel beta-helix repeat protein